MPDKIQIKKLTNANVYLDGGSFLGRAAEVDLPEIKLKMVDHKALGMIGTVRLPAGLEAMEAKFKWSSGLDPDVVAKAADPYTPVRVQIRASQEGYSSQGKISEVPVVAVLTGVFVSLPLGPFKQNEAVETETPMKVSYAKLEVDGQMLVEVDVLNNIHKAGDKDLLEKYRANIGG